MKFGLYPRLALAGIRKNKRLYVPYLLTCTGMVMMYYIIVFLQGNNMLRGMSGGTTAAVILGLGSWVVAIFACVFLFYTHSFLLRRRKKEFGLYNILGMGRRHLVRIEIWETLFVAIGTTAAGILCGIAFSKLAAGLLSMGLPSTLKIRPSVFSPTGTLMGAPVATASMPLFSPSVVPIAIHLTVSSHRCCDTYTVSELPSSKGILTASLISGSLPVNFRSSTAPTICVIFPELFKSAISSS